MLALNALMDDPTILTSSLGCTDRSWNMLSLSPSLHTWWARGYFAFRCLGVTPAEGGQGIVDLQLHWMPRPSRSTTCPRPWELFVAQNDHRSFIDEWMGRSCYGDPEPESTASSRTGTDAMLTVPHPATSRLIQTGQLFRVTLSSMADAYNMKIMLDLQWSCIKIASMSGAADSAIFLAGDDNDYDDDHNAEAAEADLLYSVPNDDGDDYLGS